MLRETFNPPASKTRLAAILIAVGAMLLRRQAPRQPRSAVRCSSRTSILATRRAPPRLRRPRCAVFTNVAGTLFLAAVTAGTVSELWRSDGTRRGTRLVKDIRPGPRPCANSKGACRGQGASSYPSSLTAVGQDPLLHRRRRRPRRRALAKRRHGTRNAGSSRTSSLDQGLPTSEISRMWAAPCSSSASDGTHTALLRTTAPRQERRMLKEVPQAPRSPTAVGSILYFGADTAVCGEATAQPPGRC